MTGPRVLPQYMGGNMGDRITQALRERQEFDRQRDIDAIQYGIGAKTLSDYEITHPAPSLSFGDRIKDALAKVTGRSRTPSTDEVNYTRGMLNNMAAGNATVNNAAAEQSTQTGQPVMPEQNIDRDLNTVGNHPPGSFSPGSFNPGAGRFEPATPRYIKLPSGTVVDTRLTPFGRQMDKQNDQQDFNARVKQAMIDAANERAGMRDNTQRFGITTRAQTSENMHNTPTPFQTWRETHALPSNPRGIGSGRTLAEDPRHRMTREDFNTNQTQLRDSEGQLRTLDATLNKPLPPLATAADSTQRRSLAGQRPALANRVSGMRQLGDSLAAAQRGDYSVPGHVGQGGGDGDASASEYRAAAAALQNAGGASNATARAVYDKIVAAIARKYGHQ